jgi:hypothetical protein
MLLKILLKKKRDLTYQYDNLLYIISKEELATNNTNQNPIRQILQKKPTNLIANHDNIINSVRKVEELTKQILLSPEIEKSIKKLIRKTKNLK